MGQEGFPCQKVLPKGEAHVSCQSHYVRLTAVLGFLSKDGLIFYF